MIERGAPGPLGSTPTEGGVNFAVHSSVAERVELCLFDADGRETRRLDLPERTRDTWHGFVPGLAAGQAYGYRVHGPYRPVDGSRCNPAKLLVDPYARELRGEFAWEPAVFDYERPAPPAAMVPSSLDSAPFVPKSVVAAALEPAGSKPRVPWAQAVVCELNVRGYTMRHPGLPDAERGRFRGLANGAIVAHLRALGVTAIELLPVHAFIDEQFLVERGLRNFWGYNTFNFFTPAARYADNDARREFREMVDAIHDAGIEVILDVVYNHTAEGDGNGPTLCFRGLDNAAYYRLETGRRHQYVNDTGTGNTIDADSAPVRALVVDSLRYWAEDMGVDGFRFDLAPILGRHREGFHRDHPLFERIREETALRDVKLIAEPWDVGPGGYQLGHFPHGWAEWNDRSRDALRGFWRGDAGTAAELARRMHGSAELYDADGRPPWASVNFVTSHDGFTLLDLVSYRERHNEANGEDNRDGHLHNLSSNSGVEGPTEDATVNAARRRRRLNLLASLMLSQGTPMLLAGDELGHSQRGNNNAYAQDNDTTWLDWSGLDDDPAFFEAVATLVRLRRRHPLLALDHYPHANHDVRPGWPDIAWLRPDGEAMQSGDWDDCRAFTMLLAATHEGRLTALAVILNASDETQLFSLGHHTPDGPWSVAFSSDPGVVMEDATSRVAGQSVVCLTAD